MSKAKTAVTRGVEFTEDNPLLVIVGIVQGNWDIQTSSTDTFPPDGNLYSDKMKDRLSAIPGGRPTLKTNWHGRAMVGAAAAPEFIQDPNHHPIVVRPGEYVKFQCDYPFMVSANRDKSVSPDPQSPDSPFTWPNGQQSTQQASPYFVIGVAQDNLHHQRFYKSEAWVTVPGQLKPEHPDPDTVGTTDGGG
jgi:hypothetical protein